MARGKNIDAGGKHGHRGKEYFPPVPPVKVEQLIAWPRGKIKTHWEKKDRGKNIIYFPPVEIRRYCYKKRLCPAGKI
jgi:hypothetical protein